MHVFFKLILLIGIGAFVFLFAVSGAIGYFIYVSSIGNPPPEIPHPVFPDWNLTERIPRETLITGIAILAGLWVLTGNAANSKKTDKKGRKRRYLDD